MIKTAEEKYEYKVNIAFSPWILKLFFISLFSILITAEFRIVSTSSYFDYLFLNKKSFHSNIKNIYSYILSNYKTEKPLFLSGFVFKYINLLIKLKMILSLLIFLMLIDFLSYNELIKIVQFVNSSYYVTLLTALIIMEQIIQIIIMKFNAMLMFNTIFPEIQSFECNNLDVNYLNLHKITVESHNSRYWIIFNLR